jgi:diamine N-acetyltransferase
MIRLERITWDNFWKVIELEVSESQKTYMPEVSVYMAQSYVNLSLKYVDQCLGIYHDKQLIGFTKIVFVPKSVEPYYIDVDSYMIDGFMIDQSFQGKGYGKIAFERILEEIRNKTNKSISFSLTCFDENVVAKRFFESFGFKKVGVKDQEKGLYIYLK